MNNSDGGPAIRLPSTTPEGLAWLQNFAPEDRESAELLVNSLRIFSADDCRSRSLQLILDRLASIKGPVGVYPVKNTRKNQHEPSPIHVDRKLPGSYVIVANIIRDAVESPPDGVVVGGNPPLEELRERSFRSILLIDDYSGSGGLAIRHGKGWMRNTSIRSWRSYGWLEVHYASFCMSDLAARNLKKEGLFDSVFSLERGVDFISARWTARERELIENLCQSYAWKSDYAYGRDRSRGLCVMPHTVPNNLPAVLWQKKGPNGGPWDPLFVNRRMNPRQQSDLAGYGRWVDIAKISEEIGQRRLARQLGGRLKGESSDLKNLLVLLGALAARKRRDHTLSMHFGVPVGVVNQMLNMGEALGLIDGQRRLTEAGWAELRSARRTTAQQLPAKALTGSNEPYYPTALRGSQ
ncbi:hypothetical protein G3I40_14525 [Streptomyces sp. SID14478]|uniref:phosphoribosyltransferase-like protein n=1 Tax=Streptomyces sp. SID14478 TaxID=2706073 RepID=UPI0013DC6D17|nr:hypothetical protein [Streptomyces sp. SID14478]NEB76430.1 hypothetical protein [Streptomyces sp. SID14478]